MDWKEQLSMEYGAFVFSPQVNKQGHDALIKHISTEIIEKLIEDIPDEDGTPMPLQIIKDQLRDKWL